jgi:hypothetical protein
LIVGRVVSITVTVCWQVLVLLHASIAAHVRVAERVFPQRALVTVPRTITWFVPHASAGAVGESKVHGDPHSTTLLLTQLIVGPVVSITVTVCWHVLVLLQASIAAHVRVAENVFPQSALVTVPSTITWFVPQESAGAVGESKVHGEPHSTTLLLAQLIVGRVVSITVTV